MINACEYNVAYMGAKKKLTVEQYAKILTPMGMSNL